MSIEFRDAWLDNFYQKDLRHRKIPGTIEGALFRKLQILDAATEESDLKIPPGNRFEYLAGNLSGRCSIRVNRQYRLIFRWAEGIAQDVYLDSHVYKG